LLLRLEASKFKRDSSKYCLLQLVEKKQTIDRAGKEITMGIKIPYQRYYDFITI
jgi:hypothetical protein